MDRELVRASDDFGFSESDMMTFMMIIMMAALMQAMVSSTAATATASSIVQSMQFKGDVESKILDVTSTVKYWDLINESPYAPLISIFLINRGASKVYVSINSAQDWLEILPGETRTVSHVGAARRIEMVFYKCDPGNASTIEAEGHF